jgi:hypothetical protein
LPGVQRTFTSKSSTHHHSELNGVETPRAMPGTP